jgi:hypothetical protein
MLLADAASEVQNLDAAPPEIVMNVAGDLEAGAAPHAKPKSAMMGSTAELGEAGPLLDRLKDIHSGTTTEAAAAKHRVFNALHMLRQGKACQFRKREYCLNVEIASYLTGTHIHGVEKAS